MSKRPPTTVSILTAPDTSAASLIGLFDVLSTVGTAWGAFVSGERENPLMDVRIVAENTKPIQLRDNLLISPDAGIEEVEDTDVVLVASYAAPDSVSPRTHNRWELDWLEDLHSRGSTIAATCTGATLMAEAGMLDGLEATTYWGYRDLVRIHYPKVAWRLDQNLCVSGEGGQLVTSGGSTNWQDLALYLIARFCGAEHAAQAAKVWVIPDRGESQAPYAVTPRSIPHNDHVVNECQSWIAEHAAIPHPINTMVEKSGLPPTTFARRFKRATGYRPIDYVHMLRIEKAKKMLEASDRAVDEIGYEVGYEDPASFRRIFKRKVSLTPSVYRRRFGHSRFERYNLMH